jgi:hypothetical protein
VVKSIRSHVTHVLVKLQIKGPWESILCDKRRSRCWIIV